MREFGGNSDNVSTRRDALKKGALVAGAAMWVTPVVQALSVSPASADQPSGGHVDSGRRKESGGHVDSGRGNGGSPVGADVDPGKSGLVNKGGD